MDVMGKIKFCPSYQRQRKWCLLLVALAILAGFSVTSLVLRHKGLLFLRQLTERYCNRPNGMPYGMEGANKENGLDGIGELVQVQVVFRHGDRSPAFRNPIPPIGPGRFSCMLDHPIEEFKKMLKRFKRHSRVFITSGGRHEHVIVTEKSSCSNGQLTAIGHVQHMLLGMHLRHAYHRFTKTFNLPEDISMKSTDYSRTVQSAAALVFGLFEDQMWKDPVNIKIIRDFSPGAHFLVDNADNRLHCKSIRSYSRAAERTDRLPNAQKANLIRLYGLNSNSIPSQSQMADLLYTRHCHSLPLPPGAGGSLTVNDMSAILDAADSFTVSKFTHMEDFQALALLSQIGKEVFKIVGNEVSYPKMVFYSGHDSVMTPLLLSLGISNGKWPPYASRIVFEIWRTDISFKGKMNFQNPTLQMLDKDVSNLFVRVLYNGEPLTKRVTFCQHHLHHNDELCPVVLLFTYVMGFDPPELDFFNLIKRKCSE